MDRKLYSNSLYCVHVESYYSSEKFLFFLNVTTLLKRTEEYKKNFSLPHTDWTENFVIVNF